MEQAHRDGNVRLDKPHDDDDDDNIIVGLFVASVVLWRTAMNDRRIEQRELVQQWS